MRQYNFAVIVSVKDKVPVGTHLPFILEEWQESILLSSHMSRANDQWKGLDGQEVLVIFNEPHAYISPSLYEQRQNVPTWNYIAVHAYGKLRILHDADEQFGLLEKMMLDFEPAYFEQWKTLDPDYKETLRKGIIAFEILADRIQAKEKLSQNRPETDRLNVKKYLDESADPMKQELARRMNDKA